MTNEEAARAAGVSVEVLGRAVFLTHHGRALPGSPNYLPRVSGLWRGLRVADVKAWAATRANMLTKAEAARLAGVSGCVVGRAVFLTHHGRALPGSPNYLPRVSGLQRGLREADVKAWIAARTNPLAEVEAAAAARRKAKNEYNAALYRRQRAARLAYRRAQHLENKAKQAKTDAAYYKAHREEVKARNRLAGRLRHLRQSDEIRPRKQRPAVAAG